MNPMLRNNCNLSSVSYHTVSGLSSGTVVSVFREMETDLGLVSGRVLVLPAVGFSFESLDAVTECSSSTPRFSSSKLSTLMSSGKDTGNYHCGQCVSKCRGRRIGTLLFLRD